MPKLTKKRDDLIQQIKKAMKEVRTVLTKGQEQRAKLLLELEEGCSTLETKIEAVSRRQQSLKELLADVNYIIQLGEPQRLSQMTDRYSEAALTEDEWKEFEMVFKGDVKTIIANAKRAADKQASILLNGDPDNPVDLSNTPFKDWPLQPLQGYRDKVKKEVGIDAEHQRRYDALQESITTNQATLRTVVANIKHAEGAGERQKALTRDRRESYKAVFEMFDQEKERLRSLYEPLRKQITGAKGALGKLNFSVRREVKFDDWINAGEDLIDLRKFRAIGDLKKEADKLSLAWRVMTPEGISQAAHDFVAEMWKHILSASLPSIQPQDKPEWMRRVGDWLYSSDHIVMKYTLEYDGVEIERLSPGTRGIVLLLLYLAIDKTDRRPLLIDQPEENLDPKSVFDDLVPHFRDARKRRQIIIVTHNANLVVNTDADQVIVASSKPAEPGRLPDINYESGSLENTQIRDKVCEILEGGERAFLERERRYRLEWEKMLEEDSEP